MRTPGEEDEDEPPGGRALERLQQFEEARGFEATEPDVTDDGSGCGDEDEQDAT